MNRFLLEKTGPVAYRWLLWRLGRAKDPNRYLRRVYRPSPWKRALFPLVRKAFQRDEGPRPECSCTWCRDVGEAI